MFEKLVAPKTEAEITKHWKYTDKVYTSVICTTYNQDSYIRDAIDSFLAQVTEYKFEIIIHDDVSTDKTREILKEYQQKYPSIIKLILQETNQFSININMPFKHSLAIAEGEYIALCEGDDFWIDENKLQNQTEVLESEDYHAVNICVHDAYVLGEDDTLLVDVFIKYSNATSIISHDLVFKDKGQFAATASYFIRKKALINLPDFFYSAPIGDLFIEAIIGVNGLAYYPSKMSAYRTDAIASWSENVFNKADKRIKYNHQLIASLKELKRFLGDRNGGLVKYKMQYIYINNASSYAMKGERTKAIKYFCLSFYPRLFPTRMFYLFLEVTGLYKHLKRIKNKFYKNDR